MNYKNKKGFTLAEILITLAIIGIVAALTIPNLIYSYQRRTGAVALKKAYTQVAQALRLMQSDENGGFENCVINDSYCLGDVFSRYLKFVTVKKGLSMEDLEPCWIDDGYYMPNKNDPKYCGISSEGIAYVFDMEYAFSNTNHKRKAYVYIDTNATNRPNLWGVDRFIFQIMDDLNLALNFENQDIRCSWGKQNPLYSGSYNSNRDCAFLIIKTDKK